VLMGATPEGKKELIGFQTGMRESDVYALQDPFPV
jgi:transposase-like protein